jgi:hypothetical protein
MNPDKPNPTGIEPVCQVALEKGLTDTWEWFIINKSRGYGINTFLNHL